MPFLLGGVSEPRRNVDGRDKPGYDAFEICQAPIGVFRTTERKRPPEGGLRRLES